MKRNMIKKIACITSLLFFPIAIATGSNLRDGLVGYWSFDGDANDMSGNGNNGTNHGATLTTDRFGNINSAYHFNGSSYIEVADSASLRNITSSITIAAWIKPTGWFQRQRDTLEFITIMEKARWQYGFQIVKEEDASYCTHLNLGINLSVQKCTGIPLNQWQFVAITFNGSQTKVYRNGNVVGTLSRGANLPSKTGNLFIGADPSGEWEYFIGDMDNVYIYNRALSASEIKALSKFIPSELEIETIVFDSNGGTGEMEDEVFEKGKEQLLIKNTFCKDGFVFQGWATTLDRATVGTVDYTDEQEITVNSDMTLYAVWDNPPLILTAESADWASGSITLRCEDSDKSGADHSYWLLYYEEMESEKKWYEIDGAVSVKANKEVDSNGDSVLIAHLKDGRFAKRMDGLRTVKYQVCDENGRLSNVCMTRRRHGLFVALSEYEGGWQTAHANHAEQANSFIRAYQDYGDAYGAFCRMFDYGAKKSLILSEIDYLADEVVTPGDVLVFYYIGHGGEHVVTCYGRGETLHASELKNRLDRLAGVGVVVILNTCHSASMISQGDTGDGMGNIGWLVSSQADEKSRCGSFTDCVLNRGWFKGAADVYGEKKDGYVTFGELALWGQDWMAKNYIRDGQLMTFYNSLALGNIVAGRMPNHASWTSLTVAPTSLTANPGKAGEINLRWPTVVGATRYDVYCRYKTPVSSSYWYVGESSATSYIAGRTFALAPDYEYEFYIRAINDVDVSPASPTATCTPTENVSLREYIRSFAQSFSLLPQSFAPPVENGEVNYSNLNYDHDGDGLTTFEEYVAGSNPANAKSTFVSKISIGEGGLPKIEWSPDTPELRATRVYRTLGKKTLMDADWVDVTGKDQSEYRFFKVVVDVDDGGGSGGDVN